MSAQIPPCQRAVCSWRVFFSIRQSLTFISTTDFCASTWALFLFIPSILCHAAQNAEIFFLFHLCFGVEKNTFISLYLNTLTFSNFIYCVSKVSKDCLCSERARTHQKQQTASVPGVIFIITSFDLLYSAVLLLLFQALHRISYLVSFVGSSAFSHAALHHQDSAYIYFPFLFLFQALWNPCCPCNLRSLTNLTFFNPGR